MPLKRLVPNESGSTTFLKFCSEDEEVLPTVRPLSRLDIVNCSRTDPRPQVMPLWPADEPVPVQLRLGVAQFCEATSQFLINCELAGHAACNRKEPLFNHVQCVCRDGQHASGAIFRARLKPTPPLPALPPRLYFSAVSAFFGPFQK